MIPANKPCPGCNNRDDQGRMMHRIDCISKNIIRGYYCPQCEYWETLEVPYSPRKAAEEQVQLQNARFA